LTEVKSTFGFGLTCRILRLAAGTLHLLCDWRKVSGSARVRHMVISQEARQSPRQSRGNCGAIGGGKVGGYQPALLILHHPLTIPPAGVSHLAGRVHFPRLDFLFAFQRGRLRQMGKGIACCQLPVGSWEGEAKSVDLQVCLLLIAPNCGGRALDAE